MTRRKRVTDALFLAAFLVCLAASMVIGDFDPVKIWNGLPRLHEFIVKILPVLRWESLGADLAEWFLPVKLWLKLLLETVLIAFLATVFGVCGAFLLLAHALFFHRPVEEDGEVHARFIRPRRHPPTARGPSALASPGQGIGGCTPGARLYGMFTYPCSTAWPSRPRSTARSSSSPTIPPCSTRSTCWQWSRRWIASSNTT